MKVGLSLSGAVTVLAVAVSMLSCQTYDFEPVEPLAIAQTTEKTQIISKKAKPNIMLLVDKSGSMKDAAGAGTRLSEMQSAMNTFLTQHGTTARMGLALFPDTNSGAGCDVACVPGKVVKPVIQSADVDAELQAAASEINRIITSIEKPAAPGETPLLAAGGTPTGASLAALANLPALLDPDRDNFVLLLTDGLPNCNNSLNASSCTCAPGASCGTFACNCLDQQNVVQVIDALALKKIKTIVVGFGADTGASVALPILNAMAEHGGFARRCETAADCGGADTCDQVGSEKLCSTRFYQATNAQELATALAKIGVLIGNADPCVFKLASKPSDPAFLAVYVNGEKVGEDAQNTWAYSEPNAQPTVTFVGDLCKKVLNATPTAPLDVEIRVVEGL